MFARSHRTTPTGLSGLTISMAALLAAVALSSLGLACEPDDDDDGQSCVSRNADTCTPLYQPTWDRVFEFTIRPGCGDAGTACHAEPGAAGAGGGFLVTDAAATREALLQSGFVVPGDESCSELMVRLDTDDDALRMPPGNRPLDEAERCSIAQWIAEGAQP